ncbi:actin nucleation-promoting factor WASL-like isoform X2 [Ruditapes philippinarum]|uniref:actin nucleation-promoting factor WASL-like isoform X2 n=1 Tax=Ruditapes philippinarum TaxID=129788 RepID=UPI00295AA7DD|nr:actin nucleation-promoting factor WASL-like isoform X2 [Ruditapes philippinarum]
MSRHSRNNVGSLLLSDQENETIFNTLGRGCVTLATAVVQLYLADSDNTQEWNKICCGVACFVKDNPNRSFFICIYDNTSQQKMWEQELYIQFKYHTPRDFFHTFEADDCQAALNFASVDEAEMFMTAIQQKILDRHNKRIHPAPQLPISTKKSGNLKSKSTDKGKGKGRKKLTKADISTPTDFRHVGHVGWDPNCGLQMDKLDPQMKALFMEIGIDEQSQVDEDTVNFIYDFVDKHGGLNAVKEDLARRKPEPSAPIDYSSSNRNQGSSLPSKPNFAPPKPPSSRSALPPIPPSRAGHSSSVSKEGVPPAPPLPPSAPPAYYAPPPPHSKPSNESRSPPVCSGRSGLLDDIVKFKGSALKPVDHSQVERSAAPAVEATGGIASALMDALNKRKPALQCSDDDDEESDDLDDDDDEWDD